MDSLKSQILSQKCSKHPSFYCDLLYLNKSATQHKVCSQCISKQQININEVISIAHLLKLNPTSKQALFPVQIDNESLQNILSTNNTLKNMHAQVDQYFSVLFQNLSSFIKEKIKQESKKIKSSIEKWKQSQITLSNLLSINKLQSILLEQGPNLSKKLHKYIVSHFKSYPQIERILQTDYLEIEKQKKSFSLDQPFFILKELLEKVQTIDFYKQKNIEPIHLNPTSTQLHLKNLDQIHSPQNIKQEKVGHFQQALLLSTGNNNNQLKNLNMKSILNTSLITRSSQVNQSSQLQIKILNNKFVIQSTSNSSWQQCYINQELQPHKKYSIIVKFQYQNRAYPELLLGLIQNHDKDQKYVVESSNIYFYSSTNGTFFKNNTSKVLKHSRSDVEKDNQAQFQRSYEVRICLSQKMWKIGSYPDYANVFELNEANWINPKVSYNFCLALLNVGEILTIEDIFEVQNFNNLM